MYLGHCTPHISLSFKLNSFFSLALFPPGNHNRKEKKLTNNYIKIKRFFKGEIYLFWCRGHLKYFLENYQFSRKSGNDAYSRGWAWEASYLRHYDALRTETDMWVTPYYPGDRCMLITDLASEINVKYYID